MSPELTTLLLRAAIIILLYLFLLQALLILRRDLKAAAGRPAYDGRLRVLESGASNLRKGDSLGLRGVNSLGRSPSSSLPLLDDFVSAEHLLLSYDGAVWRLEDLGSTNGTLVNGRRVEKEAIITYGDVIQLGQTKLRLEREKVA